MNWIKQFMILFAFASSVLARNTASTLWKFQPAERYEFCVARNLSALSMFDEEEKDRIDKIVMETSVRMHELKADPENAASTKTMLRLFAAALACVVADCDSSVRLEREKACIAAIETCSKSLKEPVGIEVVNELKRIFAAMNREMSISGDAISSNSASHESGQKQRLREEMRERLEEKVKIKREEHLEKEAISSEESDAKERFKRAYVESFGFTGLNLRPQANPTLESVIADKLLKSVTFNNLFNFRLSQNDAIFYSRSMVASALDGYGYDVINDAILAVTTAITRFGTMAGPSDYAYAIGRSISSTFDDHDLAFFADGLNIGSALVYQLDRILRPDSSSSFSSGAVPVSDSRWGASSAVVSSQTSGMASAQVNPGYVEPSFEVPSSPQNDKIQFQKRLSHFLYQSEALAEAFCTGPVPGIYEVINSALSDYGYSISSTIADIVSNSLRMLPTEAACTQYPEVVSEIIADTLGRNDLIVIADPEVIEKKISDAMSRNIQNNPPNFGEETFGSRDYPLNPSFSEFPFSGAENPEFPVDENPGSGISSSVPSTAFQQRNPDLIVPTEFSPGLSSSVIEASGKQDSDLPEELRFDGVDSPVESPPFADDSVPTNNSWFIEDYPRDVPSTFDEKNQTRGSDDIASPIILEPGPVIPENMPSEIKSVSESTIPDTDRATVEMTGVTTVNEITTSMPHTTSVQLSTIMPKSEVTTASPQVALEDAFKSKSGLSDFILKEMTSSLKALNITSSVEKKQPELPNTSGHSTEGEIPEKKDSAPNSTYPSQPTEKTQVSLDKPSSDQVGTETKPPSDQIGKEIQPSRASPMVQNWPSDGANAKTPDVITDEISGLVFGQKVLLIANNAIHFIRSPNFRLDDLCGMVNELAPIVDLPPLDVCSEIAAIDFLLHVIKGITYSFIGE